MKAAWHNGEPVLPACGQCCTWVCLRFEPCSASDGCPKHPWGSKQRKSGKALEYRRKKPCGWPHPQQFQWWCTKTQLDPGGLLLLWILLLACARGCCSISIWKGRSNETVFAVFIPCKVRLRLEMCWDSYYCSAWPQNETNCLAGKKRMSWLRKEFIHLGARVNIGVRHSDKWKKKQVSIAFFLSVSQFGDEWMLQGTNWEIRRKKVRTVNAGMGDKEPLEFTTAGQIIKISW